MKRRIALLPAVLAVLLCLSACNPPQEEAPLASVSPAPVCESEEVVAEPPAAPEASEAYVPAWEETPDSSCFSEIAYDEGGETLYLRFRDSGEAYRCFGFTADDWAAFTSAPSLGKYYNASVKGVFDCEKI